MAEVNLDVAMESTCQEIKELVKYNNITLFPTNDGIKNSKTLSKSKAVTSIATYYKIYTFIPKYSGYIRINFTLTHTITANTNTGSSSSGVQLQLFSSNDFALFDVAEGSSVSLQNETQLSNSCSVSIGSQTNYPVGTKKTETGSKDVSVTQGTPITFLLYIDDNDSFSKITTTGDIEMDIIYKEVSW